MAAPVWHKARLKAFVAKPIKHGPGPICQDLEPETETVTEH